MSDDGVVVNHHAEHPGFSGATGVLYGLISLLAGRRNAMWATRHARIGAGDHVVDIGCGPGTAARRAARRGAHVTGVDPSTVMLTIARVATRRGKISWVQGSAETLPVGDGTATVVWSLATVHHWRDVGRGLDEVVRVLRPGGRLLVVERVSPPAATGFAGHGWTAAQVEVFADRCRRAGLTDVGVTEQDSRWTVLAHRR
ncbi:class I SAM-dependent methyltransferase [Mycobacterium sp. MBM]|nr:class I SAM-dependent methyltransferase [Mycobacterium sp. MBM]